MDAENTQPQKPIKALRTFAGDVEEALGKTKSSAATIMLAEEKRREERPELAPVRREVTGEKNRLFLVLGTILLFLAISVIGGVYYLKTNEKVVVNVKDKALVNFTKESDIAVTGLSRDQLVAKIGTEKDIFKMPANSILYINTADNLSKPISAETLFTTLSSKIPSDLARSFDGKYMIGVYSFDSNDTFIIIKTNDYQIAYSGMLKWEKDLPRDLGRIFSLPQNLMGGDTAFTDEAYKNKDLRILTDSNNKTVLLYTFIDKSTLIITTNENVLSAIMGKYMINQESR